MLPTNFWCWQHFFLCCRQIFWCCQQIFWCWQHTFWCCWQIFWCYRQIFWCPQIVWCCLHIFWCRHFFWCCNHPFGWVILLNKRGNWNNTRGPAPCKEAYQWKEVYKIWLVVLFVSMAMAKKNGMQKKISFEDMIILNHFLSDLINM